MMCLSEFVKNPQIIQFLGNQCTLRRTDGALITTRYFNTVTMVNVLLEYIVIMTCSHVNVLLECFVHDS